MPSYSLWIIPDEPDRTIARKLIDSLAAQYSSLPFPPHVTLASIPDTALPLEAVAARAEALARAPDTTALPLLYTEAEAGTDSATPALWRYRCVYARVRHSANSPCGLSALRARALEALGAAEEPGGYMPHLSLLYSDMVAADRARVAESLQEIITREVFGSRFSTLQLWDTSGTEAQWRLVREWELAPFEGGE